MNNDSNIAVRELTDAELAAASGGATKIDFTILGIRFFIASGDDWLSVCTADDSTYFCTTSVGGQDYTSSGPVPK